MNRKKFCIVCLSVFLWTGAARAEVRPASVFGSNMVLQRESEVPVWGWAAPGAQVEMTVSWSDTPVRTVCGEDGRWCMTVRTPEAGGPYTVTVSDGKPVRFENVMIGEVWICSGQSNMEMPVAGWGRVRDWQKEVDSADCPQIRLLNVKRVSSFTPLDDVQVTAGGWQACSPQSVPDFSAVAYFFARELYASQHIPIGVINTSWGGTVAESWMSPESLSAYPDFADRVRKIRSDHADGSKEWEKFGRDSARWEQAIAGIDPGYRGGKCLWKEKSFDDSDWGTIELPAYFDAVCLPGHDGIVWFRKEIRIPASWQGHDLTLNLSHVDDRDITYFNGVQVGATHALERERIYTVPAALVKKGKAVIAIRVLDTGGDGGLNYDGPSLRIGPSDGKFLPLAGTWKYKAGSKLADLPAVPVEPDLNPHHPTALYNSMIRPLIPLAFRGVIWYQGESNAWRAEQYRTLFPLLVGDWRARWGREFPFYFVQLANFGERRAEPGDSEWAELRDAQMQALHLAGTGMAVIADIGDATNIHPKNKQEVGRRLGLIAEANVYGKQIPYSGPLYRSYRIEGNKIRICFAHAEGLCAIGDGTLTGFSIAGADRKFHRADAAVDGCDVVVSSPEVSLPLAVRYAWDDNPQCSLYNGAGLPASPFRTDDWTGMTAGKK